MPDVAGMPFVSVVIPTYQRRDSVARLLRALDRQTLPPDSYEVVVSIDGSTDGTREVVERHAARYRLRLCWQSNRGRAAACNAGIRAATGAIVVLLDDDMEPAPGCLAAHKAAHRAGERNGVVGAAPVHCGPQSPPVAGFVARGFEWRMQKLSRPGHVMSFREAYTGNFSIRRDVALELGAFDEGFTAYGHEDYELALRLLRAGVTLAFAPDAIARQHYEKSYAALARDAVARGTTAVRLAVLHPEVTDQLQLGDFDRRSWRWRVAMRALLAATDVLPVTSSIVRRVVMLLEEIRMPGMRRCYQASLEYFYWVGVEQARRCSQAGAAAEARPELLMERR